MHDAQLVMYDEDYRKVLTVIERLERDYLVNYKYELLEFDGRWLCRKDTRNGTRRASLPTP